MHFAAILASFAAVLSVAQALNAKQCSKELAGIVYNVESPQSKYLTRISKVLVSQRPLLFTPDRSVDVFRNFATTFQVGLVVADPFGLVTIYNADGTSAVATDTLHYTSSNFDRSLLNQPSYKIRDGIAYLTFGVFNSDAQYLSFSIFEEANQI